MRKFDKITMLALGLFLVLLVAINITIHYINTSEDSEGREYRIWINRVVSDIEDYEKNNGMPPSGITILQDYFDVSEYKYIDNIYYIKLSDVSGNQDFVNIENKDYVTHVTDNYLYKITYTPGASSSVFMWVNVVGVLMLFVLGMILIYIRQTIIKPFNTFEQLPYELSKGNLSIPLKETKGKYFGKFLWGMDLLRENLEENKKRELELQKEKKLLLLSLSHDIKTPLSAIKLYSKALSKNLYKDEAKKVEIVENIGLKADEIEGFISEIVKASNDDFLSFTVNNSEFYIKDTLNEIAEYYHEKMILNNIDFSVICNSNCLVRGDRDRAIEVIQNIVENAIKYGDGKNIDIIAERAEDDVYQIAIVNTGCALDKRELPHIFDSFYRGANVDKENGSGLGLYICKKLMQLMEGEITAKIIETDNNNNNNKMQINVLFRM